MKFCPKCGSDLHTKLIDGAKRDVCTNPECKFTFWNNPVPVVAALINYKDEYIVARNAKWPKGIFSVITGYLEQNESPEDAVLREVSEELGLTGNIKQHIGNYIFKEKNQVILCYEVVATGKIKVDAELAEIKQLTEKELADYDFSPLYITERIISDWLSLK